jgi:acetylornithine deacetylase/succinyl-diaminopimelate desuccinylase-like protein
MTTTEQLLRDVIALPSVNPAQAEPGSPRAGERRVAEFLAATAARAGLDVELRDVFPGRPNLLARLSPAGKTRRRILLAPHLDTVNANASQFTPRRQGERLHGRGACDTKGSVAAMFDALREIALRGPRPVETELVFAGLADEENNQSGSRALVASGFKADLAVVGEPTQLRVVTAHKGSLWLGLETRGKCAHGSRPELGLNAVHLMARIVDWLETAYAARLLRRRHPLLGCATVNVGAIQGGTQANIVPDHCAILVDRRTLPGETEASVLSELRRLLRHEHLAAVKMENRSAPCLPLETDPALPLVAQLIRTVSRRRPAGAQFFCDASVLAHGGIPSVVFGPGDIAQAHTADEWIALASLEAARAGLARFLRSLP